MRREVFVESFLGQKRMAVLEDGILVEYRIERPGNEKISGSVYKGTVRDILPGINSAFVNIGLEKNGFLSLNDTVISGADLPEDVQKQMRAQGARLCRGQELLVQVVKETTGQKGPRVSGNISLPGNALVYLPTTSYVGISHKITDSAERKRLQDIVSRHKPSQGGFILRTAAAGLAEDALAEEAQTLTALWNGIAGRARYAQAPALLYSDAGLVSTAVRDLLTDATEAIWFDDEQDYSSACLLAEALAPTLRSRIQLHTQNTWMFEHYGLDRLAAKAVDRTVSLPGGGTIVIDPTEALTVVDVNSGSFVSKTDLEETAFHTNLEAAAEIARQLRLRDIGGIVVIDFIDMRSPEHEKAVHAAFAEALSRDRARINPGAFTQFGLLELTRHQFHMPLHRILAQESTGLAPTLETAAREALRKLQVRTDRGESSLFLVAVSPQLLARMQELGEGYRGNAYIFADKTRSGAQYDISPAAQTDIPKAAVLLGKRK